MEQNEWVERTEWTEWNEWDEWNEWAKANELNESNELNEVNEVSLKNEFCEMSEQESDVARWVRNKSEWVGWHHLLTTQIAYFLKINWLVKIEKKNSSR